MIKFKLSILFITLISTGIGSNLKFKLNTPEKPFLSRFWKSVLIESKDTLIDLQLSYNDTILSFDLPVEHEYSISFESILNHSKDTLIELKTNTFIHLPELNSYFKEQKSDSCFLSNMKLGDTMHIYYEVEGCYNFEYGIVELIKKKRGIYSSLYVSDMSPTKNPKYKKITQDQLKSLISFEYELRTAKNESEWCTTSTFYTIELNRVYHSRSDSTCEWDGYKSLLTDIFNYL